MINRNHFRQGQQQGRKDFIQANHHIHFPEVRVLTEYGEMLGVMSSTEALAKAQAAEKDLVLVTETAKPPIVKIMDYKKFLYEQDKNKKNTKGPVMKEIQLTSNTDQNDIDIKMKKIIEFLGDGHKVKIMMKFIGRNIMYVDRGQETLLRMAEKLTVHGKIEQLPKLEGKNMFLFVSPKPKAN